MDMSEGQHEFFGILIGIPFSGTTLFLGTIKHEKERYFKTYLFLHVPFKRTCKKDSSLYFPQQGPYTKSLETALTS